jgi:hypothetical protein
MTQTSGEEMDDRPRLGELLVAMGAITPDHLREALQRQSESGVPLGRMLVEEGYVAAHTMAMALADQHGGLLRTEYGFATGRSEPVVDARFEFEPATPAAPEPLPEHEPEPEPEHEPAVEPLVLVPVTEAIAPPEDETAAIDGLSDELANAIAVVGDLRRALEAEREARQAAEALVAELRAAPAEAPRVDERYSSETHTIFFHTASGYRFAELPGAAPAAGDLVTVDGAEYETVRVGPSQLPGERTACAYLEPR